MGEVLDVGGDGVVPLVILFVLIPVVIGSVLCWLIGTRFELARPDDKRLSLPFNHPEVRTFHHSVLRRVAAACTGVGVGVGLFLLLWANVGARFDRIDLGSSAATVHFPFRRETRTFERGSI